jgi:branched-chain amino acid transport system substrate-binding protein
VLVAYAILKPTAKTDSSSISIGALLPLTGEGSIDGEDAKSAIDLAVQDLKNRGINVKIDYEDDRTSPQEAISGMHRLEQKQVKAVIGGAWSFLAEAVVPISEQTKLVTISPTATKEFVGGTSPYFFFGGTENSLKAKPLASWLSSRNFKSVAIIVSKDAWGLSNKAAFAAATAQVGGSVVLTEEIPFGSEADTLPTVVTKISQLRPDVILWTGYEPGAATLIQKVGEQHLQIPVVAASASLLKAIRDHSITPAPGSELYILDYKVPEEFNQKFQSAYGHLPASSYAHRFYDSVFLLAENIQKDPAKNLADKVRLEGYLGYGGQYQFTVEGYLKTGSEWIINKVQ